MNGPFDFVMHEAGLTFGTPGYARATCLMYLSEGLDTSMCDPQTYVDEDCPDVRQVDFLPDDLIEDAASSRLVALRMLRYAHASGFAQVAKLAQAAAINDASHMVKLADEMFATVPAQEMLAYGLDQASVRVGGAA